MANRQALEPDRPCLGGCGQLLMAAAWDASHGHCAACWNRVRGPVYTEAEEKATDWARENWDQNGRRGYQAGYKAAAESRDQRIKEQEARIVEQDLALHELPTPGPGQVIVDA